VVEDETVDVTLTATDANNDELTFSLQTNPTNGILLGDVPNITYRPNPDWHGTDTFTYTAHDGELESEIATVTISVSNADDEIVVTELLPSEFEQTINETETLNFSIIAEDPDGNELEYLWKLDDIEVSITNTYGFVTDYESSGVHIITLDVTDNFRRNSLYYEWNVNVVNVDQDIVIIELLPEETDLVIDETETVQFSVSAEDPDGTPILYSWKQNGVEVSNNNSFDFITDYFGENSAGDYTISLDIANEEPRSPERILFIGNSITYYNGGVNQHLLNLALSADETDPIDIDASTIPGATLMQHWNNGDAVAEIQTGNWDLVVLQERTATPVEDPELFYQYVAMFDSVITLYGAETILFHSWPYRGTFDTMIEEQTEAFDFISNELEIDVVNVARAWDLCRDEHQEIELFNDDGNHPNVYGTYLASCSFYSYLWEQSPVGIAYVNSDDISESDKLILQEVAWESSLNYPFIDDLSFNWNVTVNNVNRPPVVEDRNFDTIEESEITITLSGTDPDEDELTFYITDTTQYGVYSDNVYTPNTNYFGSDYFKYIAFDGIDYSDTAIVVIIVHPVNDTPMEFNLISPVNDSTIVINVENIEDTLEFVWSRSFDPDYDVISYSFTGYDDLDFIEFDSTSDTTFAIGLSAIVDEMNLQDVDMLTGSWKIFATDGIETISSAEYLLTIDATELAIDEIIPLEYSLLNPYPNPFNPITTVSYQLPSPSSVLITIYNIQGQLIETLVNSQIEAGYHSVIWNAPNQPSGLYFIQMVSGDYVFIQKVLLLK